MPKPADDKTHEINSPELDELTPELHVALPRTWLVGAGAAFLVLIAAAWLWSARGRDSAHQNAADAMEKILREDGALAQDQSLAVYRLAWKEQQSQLADGVISLEALQRGWREHQQQLAALLDSADGQRIANDSSLIDQFAAILDGSGSDAQFDSKQRAETVAQLQPIVDEALRAQVLASPPATDFVKRVQAFHDGVVQDLQGLHSWREQLAGLIVRSRSLSTDGPTLRVALANRKTQQDQRLSKEVTEQWKVREAELEAQRVAAVMAARNEKKMAEDHTVVVSEQDAAARAKAERVAAERQAAAAETHRQRLAQFHKELPDIRPFLSPFISPGKMQLGKNGWETSAEQAPLSWSALQGVIGAPGDRRSAGFLANAFGEIDTKNDRPFGSFPRRYQPDVDAAAMARIVEFLHAHGDLMVEEGLLKP